MQYSNLDDDAIFSEYGIPDNLISLDKLITRLKTDLKLSKTSWVAQNNTEQPSTTTQRKNLRKASMLYYLESLKKLKTF